LTYIQSYTNLIIFFNQITVGSDYFFQSDHSLFCSNAARSFRRNLKPLSTCQVCGIAVEDARHATVNCTKGASVRQAMRDHWPILIEEARLAPRVTEQH
jgi:hypothetical protein